MENMKVSIGIVIALIMQVSGFVWWTAQQAQTIDDLESKVSTLTAKSVVADEINIKRDVRELQLELKEFKEKLEEHETWISENYADIEDLIEFAEFTENKWADAYDSDPGYERIFGTR